MRVTDDSAPCRFCGRSLAAARLVESATGVRICDSCVRTSLEIIAEGSPPEIPSANGGAVAELERWSRLLGVKFYPPGMSRKLVALVSDFPPPESPALGDGEAPLVFETCRLDRLVDYVCELGATKEHTKQISGLRLVTLRHKDGQRVLLFEVVNWSDARNVLTAR